MSVDTDADTHAETPAALAHVLGPVGDIPVGEGRAYAVDGEQIAVFRLRDGTLHAISGTCPHAGGPLADGLVDTKIVMCPLHNHTFELDSGASRTGQPPVRVYPAYVDDDGLVTIRTH
jgi:nitrite reductase/ring-hydroxylating ferredoxin subunit